MMRTTTSRSSFTSKRAVRGAVMVEMAILVSLLVLLFVGITELGRALYFQHKLTKSAEAGARYLARAYEAVDPATCAGAAGWTAGADGAANIAATGRADGSGTPIIPELDAADVTSSVVSRTVTADGVPEVMCVVQLAIAVPYRGIFFGGGDGFLPPVILGGDGATGWTLTAASEERYVGD